MKTNDLHNYIADHYKRARNNKNKNSIHIESVVGQAYRKKPKQVQQQSPLQDFLRNEEHISVQPDPLYFRELPRKLKVYFPGPPAPPPKLQQVPYTYEIVPNVPFKMPKQKPGYVGDWVLEQSRFVHTRSAIGNNKKHNSMIENYRSVDRVQNKNRGLQRNDHQKRMIFRSQLKSLVRKMKDKSITLKQIIKNKGLIKKSHNFYNSSDFFLMCREGDQSVESLLANNPQLAFDIDEQSMTGLHWAAREGHANLCRLLTQRYHSNCHAKDCYGRTPLHLAVENKNIECIIRIFIEGGQLSSMNKGGKTVRNVAKDAYVKYLIEKLEEIKFVIRTKKYENPQDRKNDLEQAIRSTLDQSSLYF